MLLFISLGPAFITELWCLASKEAFAMPKSYFWGTMSLKGGTESVELKTFLDFFLCFWNFALQTYIHKMRNNVFYVSRAIQVEENSILGNLGKDSKY